MKTNRNRATPHRASKSIFVVALLLLISACTNPVDPQAAYLGTDPAAESIGKTTPVLEVTYLIWSEKGIPSEVDVSMWSPVEGFVKERVELSTVPVRRTFYIHPDEYRDVDLVLYKRTEGAIVRAQIHINGLVVAQGNADGFIPLVSLDTRTYEWHAQALTAGR